MSMFEELTASEPAGPSCAIDPRPDALIGAPLDYILAEHNRQRQAAQLLLMVAGGAVDGRAVLHLAEFLENDFATHLGDEEHAYFPLLRARCLPEDAIDGLITRLIEERRKAGADGVARGLRRLLSGESLAPEDSLRLRDFAEHVRQQIALENGVLLPIARVRVDEASLRALSERLVERRTPSPA